MYKMGKLGFSLQEKYSIPIKEVLLLLKKAGFDGVSPPWQGWENLDEIARSAQETELVIHSLHAPHDRNCALWEQADSSILQETLACIDACQKWTIPILVIHPWGKMDYTFRPDTLCFAHFDRLVESAAEKGVKIAFENLQCPEYLMALLDRYANSSTAGFCWDSGHELCYPPSADLLKLYGDRLIFTHLNDNLGSTQTSLWGGDDLHLLPMDGKADWNKILQRLKASAPQQVLNFELKISPKPGKCKVDLYGHLPLEEFLKEAAHRANDLAKEYF